MLSNYLANLLKTSDVATKVNQRSAESKLAVIHGTGRSFSASADDSCQYVYLQLVTAKVSASSMTTYLATRSPVSVDVNRTSRDCDATRVPIISMDCFYLTVQVSAKVNWLVAVNHHQLNDDAVAQLTLHDCFFIICWLEKLVNWCLLLSADYHMPNKNEKILHTKSTVINCASWPVSATSWHPEFQIFWLNVYVTAVYPVICAECACNLAGTVLGTSLCNVTTGQCRCKPNTELRDCSRCKDGYFAFPSSTHSTQVCWRKWWLLE